MKSRLEYHLFARFAPNVSGVRVAVTLSERKVQELGNALFSFAEEVWYRIRPRSANARPYRQPRHARS